MDGILISPIYVRQLCTFIVGMPAHFCKQPALRGKAEREDFPAGQ